MPAHTDKTHSPLQPLNISTSTIVMLSVKHTAENTEDCGFGDEGCRKKACMHSVRDGMRAGDNRCAMATLARQTIGCDDVHYKSTCKTILQARIG